MKLLLSRLLHLGVTISRRSSGGDDDMAVDECQVLVLKCFLVGVVCMLLG